MAVYSAVSDGCIGTRYIRAGETFEYDGPAPSWARLVKKDSAPKNGGSKKGK